MDLPSGEVEKSALEYSPTEAVKSSETLLCTPGDGDGGLCLGIDEQSLGIEQNSTIEADDVQRIKSLLGPPVEEKKKRKKKPKPAVAA